MQRHDLNLLIAFEVLYDERNVTRAAKRLSLTQSAVSGILKRLRIMLDDPLFVRAQRGIVPTPRAERLAPIVREWLADADRFLAPEIFDPGAADMTITVSANDYVQLVIVGPLIRELRKIAPGIRLAVTMPEIPLLADRLTSGEVDLAISVAEFCPPDFPALKLFQDRYVGAIRDNSALAGKRVTLDEFCRYDHVLVSPTGGDFKGVTDDALERLGRLRRVVLSVPSFQMVPAILRADDLIALVPERMASLVAATGLYFFEPPLKVPKFEIFAVWHRRVHRDSAHIWFRKFLAQRASPG